MTKAREESYLYNFTYGDPGKRSRLGAHHGDELFFLSDSFSADWNTRTKINISESCCAAIGPNSPKLASPILMARSNGLLLIAIPGSTSN
jgi:hypothetical protein